MSDLFGNHIVGFPTRRLTLFTAPVMDACISMSKQRPLFTNFTKDIIIVREQVYNDDIIRNTCP